MYWSKVAVIFLLAGPLWAVEGYVVGIGAEVDNADAIAMSVSGELAFTENTWLSAAAAKSSVDLARGTKIETVYGNVGIDHYFDPIGIRLSIAYWGDSDILDSDDQQASLYWRSEKFTLSGDYERRDFTFDIFRDSLIPDQDFRFSSDGVGLSARWRINDSVDVSLSGMDYDYDVNLRRAANRPIVDFLSVSRLSLVNGLTDYRLRAGIGLNVGEQRWDLDVATSKGEVDRSSTLSTTLRFLTPMGKRSDIEFGLGIDRSDDYGSAILFSVFAFFYG